MQIAQFGRRTGGHAATTSPTISADQERHNAAGSYIP
jgi:hypothetical protein